MNPTHKKMKTMRRGSRHLGAPLLALALLVAPLQGCYKVLIFPYKTCFSPQVDAQIIKLEEELDQIKLRYEAKEERLNGSIDRQKKRIEELLAKKNHSGALNELESLWRFTHPCDVEDCDKMRDEAEDPMSVPDRVKDHDMFDRARIDREDRFIKSSLQQILDEAQEQLDQGLYDEVDRGLLPVRSMKIDYRVKKKIASLHERTKTTWLEKSEARAKALVSEFPAAAYLYHQQAVRLALRIEDEERARKNAMAARKLRDEIFARHSLKLTPTTQSGDGAREVIGKVSDLLPYISTRQGGVRAELSLTLGEPSFRREVRTGQDSFRYVSGTRSIPNPDYEAAKHNCERRTREHEQELFECSTDDGPCGSYVTEDFMEEACAQVNRYSPTTTEDTYSDYSYPTKIHALVGELPFSANVSCEGRASIGDTQRAQATLEDVEHESYSMNHSGVKRNPATPPTERDGVRSLRLRATSKLIKLINSAAIDYRNGLIEETTASTDARLDDLVTYTILEPHTTPEKLLSEMQQLSNMSDVKELFAK